MLPHAPPMVADIPQGGRAAPNRGIAADSGMDSDRKVTGQAPLLLSPFSGVWDCLLNLCDGFDG